VMQRVPIPDTAPGPKKMEVCPSFSKRSGALTRAPAGPTGEQMVLLIVVWKAAELNSVARSAAPGHTKSI